MSRRFGRNQRRRARESIAALERDKQSVMELRKSELKAHIENMRDLRDDIKRAKEILAPGCIAFPAETDYSDMEARDFLLRGMRVPVTKKYSFDEAMDLCATAPALQIMETMTLEFLATSVDYDAMSRRVHARVHFQGKSVAYGITDLAWNSMNRNRQYETILREISKGLSKELINQLKKL